MDFALRFLFAGDFSFLDVFTAAFFLGDFLTAFLLEFFLEVFFLVVEFFLVLLAALAVGIFLAGAFFFGDFFFLFFFFIVRFLATFLPVKFFLPSAKIFPQLSENFCVEPTLRTLMNNSTPSKKGNW